MTGPPAATAACRLAVRRVLADHDGPVLAAVSGGADSLALAARVDGVVSVVRADEVSRGTVSRVRDQLRNVHANLLGFGDKYVPSLIEAQEKLAGVTIVPR